jgi:hypothetical protein
MILISHVKPNLAKSLLYPMDDHQFGLHYKIDSKQHWPTSQVKLLKQRACHTVALPFTLKSICILRQKKKKNYENSNISPCKKYNLQKKPLKETRINPSRRY